MGYGTIVGRSYDGEDFNLVWYATRPDGSALVPADCQTWTIRIYDQDSLAGTPLTPLFEAVDQSSVSSILSSVPLKDANWENMDDRGYNSKLTVPAAWYVASGAHILHIEFYFSSSTYGKRIQRFRVVLEQSIGSGS